MKNYISSEEFKEGDIIYFEMPPFCSGEYSAKVKKDDIGLYFEGNNYMKSCRDYRINNPYWS